MPGISGRGAIVRRLKHRDEWTNSGYGLYMTSRAARKAGTFLIGSGSAALMLSGPQSYPIHWEYPGTAVRMEFFIDRIDDLKSTLAQFRRDADDFCRVNAGTALTPSVASQMLARDFA